MECADKAARSHRTPAMGDTRAFAGNWAPDSTRAAATALSLGCNTFIRYGCIAESKAAAGKCPKANPVVPSGTANFGRGFRRLVAAALQNLRSCLSLIVSSLESAKSLVI